MIHKWMLNPDIIFLSYTLLSLWSQWITNLIYLVTLFICLSFRLFMISLPFSQLPGITSFILYSFFFFSIFANIPPHRHNDTLNPGNFFLLTWISFILMENKPVSHYARAVCYSGKGSWLEIRIDRFMNLGKWLHCLILCFIICKIRKMEWVISEIPIVLGAATSSAFSTKESTKMWGLQREFLPQRGLRVKWLYISPQLVKNLLTSISLKKK